MRKLFPLFFFFSSFAAGCSFEYNTCDDDPADVGGDPQPVPCPDGKLCIDVSPLTVSGDARSGHLAVVWYQLDPDDPDPVREIGYSRPFETRDQKMEIDLDSIALPKDEALLLCERDCADEAKCACQSETKIGIATVVLADDVDRDGRIALEEIDKATYGRGWFLIAHSDKETSISPPPFDAVFSDGFARGTAAYRFVGNPEDRVERASDGERFVLNVCADTREEPCELPFPELRGF